MGTCYGCPPPPADFDRSAERLQFVRPLARRMLTIVRNARAWTTLIARGEVEIQDLSHVWIYNQRLMETEAWPPPFAAAGPPCHLVARRRHRHGLPPVGGPDTFGHSHSQPRRQHGPPAVAGPAAAAGAASAR